MGGRSAKRMVHEKSQQLFVFARAIRANGECGPYY
jgi:hypothetical protein